MEDFKNITEKLKKHGFEIDNKIRLVLYTNFGDLILGDIKKYTDFIERTKKSIEKLNNQISELDEKNLDTMGDDYYSSDASKLYYETNKIYNNTDTKLDVLSKMLDNIENLTRYRNELSEKEKNYLTKLYN